MGNSAGSGCHGNIWGENRLEKNIGAKVESQEKSHSKAIKERRAHVGPNFQSAM